MTLEMVRSTDCSSAVSWCDEINAELTEAVCWAAASYSSSTSCHQQVNVAINEGYGTMDVLALVHVQSAASSRGVMTALAHTA